MTGKEKALFLAYPTVWTFSVVSFWCFGSASDALGFTLLHLRCDRRHFDRSSMECSVPPVAADAPDRFGSGLHALRFFTFRLANMAAFSHPTPPEWIMLPVGLALSLAGLLLGRILRRFVSGKD